MSSKRLDYHPPMIISALPASGGYLLVGAPEFVEGAIIPFWADLSGESPAFKKFNDSWQAAVKADPQIPDAQKPVIVGTEGMVYSGMLAIISTMRKAGITGDTPLEEARLKLRDGFQNIGEFPSIFGPVKLLPSGQTVWKATVFTVEKGQIKMLVR